MLVIEILNYEVPDVFTDSGKDDRYLWRRNVRSAIRNAIKKINVPGIKKRNSITFVFGPEWKPNKDVVDDPMIARVFIKGLKVREDRPTEMRQAMARAIGDVLIERLESWWCVEIYSREGDSPIVVKQPEKNDVPDLG